MAVAAGLVAALGRRLVSPAAGLAAGLVFAVLPQVSLYAQDARSYAMVTALGAAGSYLLLRAIGAPGRRRGWLTGYAACLGAMAALNIFGILLLAAHAVSVALACLRQPAPAARLRLALGWLAAAAAAVILASPVLTLGIEQRGTASWIRPPGPRTVASLWRLARAAAPGHSHLRGRRDAAWRPARWPAGRRCARTGRRRCPRWRFPGWCSCRRILIGISFVTPLYVPRYVLYCLPAAALLAGAGLAALGRGAAAGLAAAGRAGGPQPGRWQAWPGRLGWATGAAALAVIALLGYRRAGQRARPGRAQ